MFVFVGTHAVPECFSHMLIKMLLSFRYLQFELSVCQMRLVCHSYLKQSKLFAILRETALAKVADLMGELIAECPFRDRYLRVGKEIFKVQLVMENLRALV